MLPAISVCGTFAGYDEHAEGCAWTQFAIQRTRHSGSEQSDARQKCIRARPSELDNARRRSDTSNNTSRTGANLCETELTPYNVNAKQFGHRFSFSVMGQVYAQPRIATHVPQVLKASDAPWSVTATSPSLRPWKTSSTRLTPMARTRMAANHNYWYLYLGPPLPVNRIPRDIGAFLGHFNIYPYIGITSTPVIDPEKTTIFLVAKIAVRTPVQMYCDGEVATPNCPVVNGIFALNLSTGAVRDSMDISLPRPDEKQTDPKKPHPCAILDNRNPTVDDAGRINMQRPALLLTGSPDRWHIYLGSVPTRTRRVLCTTAWFSALTLRAEN